MASRLIRDERGSTLETVLAVPVLLTCIMLTIQFGLWYHGTHVAEAAAQEGARAARLEQGTAQDGQDVANSYLTRFGSAVVVNPHVVPVRTRDTARVVVDGEGESVLFGWQWRIHAVSEGPVERFRPVTERKP